jgi:DNA-binding transcriptional LysR family regulator
MAVRDCIIGGTAYARLAGRGLSFKDLRRYPLMLIERDSNSRAAIDAFAAAHGAVFSPALELGSNDLLARCAAINLGLAVVTKEFTDIDGASLYEIPFTPDFPVRAVGLIKLKGVGLPYAADRFAGMFM